MRFDALSSAPYRRFWLGSIASVGSTQLYFISKAWLVFELSGSALNLGLLGASTAVPTIIATLIGGLVADRINRRSVLILTSGISSLLLILLGILDASELVMVWHVLLISCLLGLVQGFDFPARSSIFPSLIDKKQMMSAVSLNSILWQGSRMILPAIGGFLISITDTSLIFFICGTGFFCMMIVLIKLEVRQDHHNNDTPLNEFLEGVKYVLQHRIFLTLIFLSWISMFFGTSYVQIMPLFADMLNSGERGFGLLISATGVGSIIGNLFISRYQESQKLGIIMLTSAALAPFSLIGFSLVALIMTSTAGAFWLACCCVVIASVLSSVFLVSSMTILQVKVPDTFRGRVMGIHSITFSMISLGGLAAGVLAAKFTAPIAVIIGALIVIFSVTLTVLKFTEIINIGLNK